MWQSTISLRYVSYKNADSNLHERICAMAMMAKNLLWSCAQIVAPRPPINPKRPNHVIERTADRLESKPRVAQMLAKIYKHSCSIRSKSYITLNVLIYI